MPHLTRRQILGVLGLLGLGSATACSRRDRARAAGLQRRRIFDALSPLHLHDVQIKGYLGAKLDQCIAKRIFAQDAHKLIAPLQHTREPDCRQGEFWGNWFASATAACQYTGDAGQKQQLSDSVQELLRTQTKDGFIGNSSPDDPLGPWDIWGRTHTLEGLLAWYDLTGDTATLNALKGLTDRLIAEVGPGKLDIARCGMYHGMGSGSVLRPVTQLYRRTGGEQYLQLAEYIISRWSSVQGPQLVEKALKGVPVADRFPRPENLFSWQNGVRAAEMMSCYAGLLELYRETGRTPYLNAAFRTYRDIRDAEINIAGSGTSEECWYGGKERQVQPARDTMETCVAVRWMEMCADLMQITGDSHFFDELEHTAYNALLGALTSDASAFARFSSLEGERELGSGQCGMDLNCCMTSGPRGLMLLAQTAIMTDSDGFAINLYSEGNWHVKLSSGADVGIEVATAYPFDGMVEIRLKLDEPRQFPIRLRIPYWSRETALKVNRETIENFRPGEFAIVDRRWESGDKIHLQLDFRGRILERSAEGQQYVAIVRGPLVLARDLRLGQKDMDRPIAGISSEHGYVVLRKATPPEGMKSAFCTVGSHELRVCDYASAGNSWDARSRFRVWMPYSGPAVGGEPGRGRV